jgi:hypothetical protein
MKTSQTKVTLLDGTVLDVNVTKAATAGMPDINSYLIDGKYLLDAIDVADIVQHALLDPELCPDFKFDDFGQLPRPGMFPTRLESLNFIENHGLNQVTIQRGQIQYVVRDYVRANLAGQPILFFIRGFVKNPVDGVIHAHGQVLIDQLPPNVELPNLNRAGDAAEREAAEFAANHRHREVYWTNNEAFITVSKLGEKVSVMPIIVFSQMRQQTAANER